MTSLSVVVPATDGPPSLGRCEGAVRNALDPPEEVLLVTEPRGLPAGVARNVGAAKASGDVLVFVDSDVLVHADAFVRIRAAFDADPALDALFGSYDDAVVTHGTVAAFRNLLHHHVHHASAGPAGTFWTGLGAVRRSAFEAIGGFDVSQPRMEDVELGLRLAEAGRTTVLDPGLQGTHLKEWSLAEMVWADFALRGIPWLSLLLRRRAFPSSLNLGWRHRLSAVVVLVAALALLLRRPAGAAAAAAGLVVLNAAFYRLLLRRLGPGGAAVGVGLHALHHLTALAAVPAAVALHLLRRRR